MRGRRGLEHVEHGVAGLHAAALAILEVHLEADLLVEVDRLLVVGDRDTDVVEAVDRHCLPSPAAAGALTLDFGPPGSGRNGPSRASRKARMPPCSKAWSRRWRSGPPIEAWTMVLSGPLRRWPLKRPLLSRPCSAIARFSRTDASGTIAIRWASASARG